MDAAADVNTVVLEVDRVMADCGGLRVVVGRRQCDTASVTAREDSVASAVFRRDTVSSCHIGPGTVVAIHPPW